MVAALCYLVVHQDVVKSAHGRELSTVAFRYSRLVGMLEEVRDYATKYDGWKASDGFHRGVIVGWAHGATSGDPFLLLDCTAEDPSKFHGGVSFQEVLLWNALVYVPETRKAQLDTRRISWAFVHSIIELIRPPTNSTWPHKCTACKRPAQLIFNMVDCSSYSCRHYRGEKPKGFVITPL